MNSRLMFSRTTRVRLLAGILACTLLVTLAGCGGRQSEQRRQRADTLLRIGQVSQALEEYERAIAANPDNAAAFLGQGRAQSIRNDHEEALASFRRAIELTPDYEEAYVEAVQLMVRQGRGHDAAELAAQFAEIAPVEGGILHGRTLMSVGAREQALSVFAELRSEFPEEVPVHINSAMTYLQANRTTDAEEVLQHVLAELDDRSLPARMALIDVYRAQDKLPEAIEEFRTLVSHAEDAYDADPDDRQAREHLMNMELTLARSLLEAGQHEEAEEIATPILHDHPESGWANYVVGACLLEREEYGEALQYLQTAARGLPQQPQVDRRLTLARRGGLEPEREREPGVEATADRPEAEETWETLWRQGRLRELLGQRDRFLEGADRETREAFVVASMILRNIRLAEELAEPLGAEAPLGQIFEAFTEQDYQRLLELVREWEEYSGKREAVRQNAQGFVFTQLGLRAEAFGVLNSVLEEHPGDGATLLNLAFMYQAANMPEFMAGAIERLTQTYPDILEHRVLLVGALLDADKPDEARNRAESMYSVFPRQSDALILLASTYAHTGEAEFAVDVLKRGVQDAPDDVQLQAALAESLLRTGQLNGARELLDELSGRDGVSGRVARMSAFVDVLENEWDQALTALEDKDVNELDMVTRLLYAAALIRTEQTERAREPLTQPDGVTPVLPRRAAVIWRALGVEDATPSPSGQALAEELAGNPEQLARYTLAQACEEARYYYEAYQAYRQVYDDIGGQPYLLSQMMGMLALADRVDDPAGEGQALAEAHPDTPEAWIGLSRIHEQAQDNEARRQALRRATEAEPDSAAAWRALAQYANEISDYTLALECYRELKRLDPDSPIVNNNLAYFLLASGEDPNEALPLAQAAHAELQDNPHVIHTVGLAHLRLGELDEAQRNLDFALQMRPGDPTLLLDFGQLLVELGRTEEGRRHAQWAVQFADRFGLDFPRRDEALALAETG